MIDYIAKAETAGVEVRLIYCAAPDKYYVIYGAQRTEFTNIQEALDNFTDCVRHGAAIGGHHD